MADTTGTFSIMNNKLLEYFKGDELAATVWKTKYSVEGEETPTDMHARLAREFYRAEKKFISKEDREKKGLSEYGKSRPDLTLESIFNLFDEFKWIIPQGSIMYGLGRPGVFVSYSNCYVLDSPEDSYGSILAVDEQLVQLTKRRAGVGLDLSNLRYRGAPVSNSANTSTGAASFMERYSHSTRECGQAGRRGALMLSMDVTHPDIEEFTTMKSDLSKVTGANVSIRLTDEFMRYVKNNRDFDLKFPVSGPESKVIKTVQAGKLWDTIIKQARDNSEPGLLFWDNILDYGPDGVYEEFKPVCTNPCGEIPMQKMDSCRLMLINLFSFVNNPFTPNATIDLNLLYQISYENQRLMDDLVELEIENINGIIAKIQKDKSNVKDREILLWQRIQDAAYRGRRTGSGLTALGDMLAALGLKYDSEEALDLVREVMYIKFKGELDATIDLAVLRGPFPGWDSQLEYPEYGPEGLKPGNSFYKMILEYYSERVLDMYYYGRRNVSMSTIAPAGSVSILTQTTSGCEPLFMPFYKRRKKLNHADENERVDFVDDLGDKWQEYFVLHPKFKDWLIEIPGVDPDTIEEEELNRFFEQSPWYGSTANDIDWIKRVEMQSVLQQYVTHSISSTLNLPEDVTYEEVNDIYMESWKKGLKGVTIYRDGSRSGVLVSNKDKYDRPTTLDCNVYHTTSMGNKYTILIGLKDDKPFEIFCVPTNMATNYDKGQLVKEGDGTYTLTCGNTDKFGVFKNVTDKMTPDQQNLTRAWSLLLKTDVPISKIVDQIEKTTDPITGFSKAVSRVLGTYIPDGTKSGLKCLECGSKEVVFEEGCSKCTNCGTSACG